MIYDLVYKNRTINKTAYYKNGHSLYLSMTKHREDEFLLYKTLPLSDLCLALDRNHKTLYGA